MNSDDEKYIQHHMVLSRMLAFEQQANDQNLPAVVFVMRHMVTCRDPQCKLTLARAVAAYERVAEEARRRGASEADLHRFVGYHNRKAMARMHP